MAFGKLFIIAPSAYPLGGVAVWLDYLVPGLRERGWDVQVGLVSGRHHDAGKYQDCYPALGRCRVIDNPTGSRQGRVDVLCRTIRQADPSLVVAVNIPDVYEAVNRLRMQGDGSLRVAMALHGIQPDLIEDARYYRDALDGVICTNRLTARLLEAEAGIESGRIGYAPYGVEMTREGTSRQPDADQRLRIAWVGRIEQAQKRVLDLPEIAAALERQDIDYAITVAGDGPDRQQLAQTLEASGLSDRCTFAGTIPPERMRHDIYDCHDLLLVTSLWETGPIIIWEAMVAGMPVVSSRYIGSGLEGSLVDGKNCLLFDIGDASGAAAGIARLAREPGLYRRIMAGGRELVEQRYSRPVSIAAWEQALANVLERPPRDATSLAPIEPAGRLDRLLGVRWGERVRRAMGLRHEHASAGGEWPHSYQSTLITDNFWKALERADQRIDGKY